ncbi:MAG: DUF1501 domain-containing protein, partial [Afipia sp.]|nr:DUF1501 domain-containing protein [Afipia sp.]
ARMQLAAPEALDLKAEPAHVLKLYGLDGGPQTWPKEISAEEEAFHFSKKCLAARRLLERAGQRVAGVIDQAALVSTRLSETSGALISGASAIQELLADYRTQRDAIGHLMTELRNVVEVARKEATLTGDILARIENSATRLATAQTQADTYLDGVSKVLGEAHQSFADEIKRTLDRANHEFHAKLTTAVQLLSASIAEFETTLATAGVRSPVRS